MTDKYKALRDYAAGNLKHGDPWVSVPTKVANELLAERDALLEAMLTIAHSMQQAAIPGNDKRREIALSERVAVMAIAAATKGES